MKRKGTWKGWHSVRKRIIIIKSNKKFLTSTTKSVLCTVHIVASSRGCVPMIRDSLLAGIGATEGAEQSAPMAAILRSMTRHQWYAADTTVFPVWEIICHYIRHKEEAVACCLVFFSLSLVAVSFANWLWGVQSLMSSVAASIWGSNSCWYIFASSLSSDGAGLPPP